MLKSASSPKKKTNPLLWVGVAVLAFVAYSSLGGGDEPTATTPKKTKKGSTAKGDVLFTDADYHAKFAPVGKAAVDVFNPLVKKTTIPGLGKLAIAKPSEVPATLTGGEPNWYYTGLAELDGVRQGLLENTVSGESAYVGVGDNWKAAKIVSIDVGVIAMSTQNGSGEFRVPIVGYGDTPGMATPAVQLTATGASQPLNVPGAALTGAIGGGIGVRPVGGAPITALPDPAAVAESGQNDNNNQGGRRRGRRNRNQNQGDPGVNNAP